MLDLNEGGVPLYLLRCTPLLRNTRSQNDFGERVGMRRLTEILGPSHPVRRCLRRGISIVNFDIIQCSM